MIRAICFDFDGTLARYQGDFSALSRTAFSGLKLSPVLFDQAEQRFAERVRRQGPSTLLSVLRGVTDDLAHDLSEEDLEHAADIMNAYLAEMALLPGARKVLSLTRAIPRAIITNGPSDMQRAAIKQVGTEDKFQTIVVSGDEDVAVRKPNPRIFEIACERLGVESKHVLMVGDNLEADVKGALAYGMQAIWIAHSAAQPFAPDCEWVPDTAALHAYLKPKLSS